MSRGNEVARARYKAKRAERLKNIPYPGFICNVCRHKDMMHRLFVGDCILPDCDCQSMDGIALIKGDVTERLQTGMSPNGYTEGENK